MHPFAQSFHRRPWHALCAALLALLALPAAPALADPSYALTLIGASGSSASGINSAGDVVGSFASGGATHAFVYADGSLADLGTLGGLNSYAYGINDAGQVVGGADATGGLGHAFLYSGGAMSDIGTAGTSSAAMAINNHGVVVGQTTTAAGPFSFPQAFSYADGSTQLLGTLPGGLGSYAYAVNDKGLAAGASYKGPFTAPEYPLWAVTYQHGKVAEIGAPDLGDSAVYGINELGQLAGGIPTSTLIHASHAFVLENGTLVDLGAFAGGIDDSIAYDINNLGAVVGRSSVDVDVDHYGYHGFLYTGSGLVDLNTLIDPASGWVITNAASINDAGQIAATACFGGVSGDCRAVRLDVLPVPEPESWAMLACGFGLLSVLRRGRRVGGSPRGGATAA